MGERHSVAARALPCARMEGCMPVRYSGARAAGETEIKAVQQIMLSEMRMVGEVQTWARNKQWWVVLPPGTLQVWQTSASNFVARASSKH